MNDLKLNKQNKGNYVSATTLDNYYTKEQTSAATAIQEALNCKQDTGNYALKSDLISGYSEDDLVGLIKKLDEKITKLENK